MAHVFDRSKRSPSHTHRFLLLGTFLLVVLMMASAGLVLKRGNQITVTRAAVNSKFIFTAAGDYDQTPATTANLNAIAQSGANFHLALGDFSYNTAVTAAQWSSFVIGLLPANFPFEIIPGDHDVSQLAAYATNLPDHIGNISGKYAQEYYFDYPHATPLARFIMLSPGILSGYNYTLGGSDYNWVATAIDNARAAGIPWVMVGMYQDCFSLGSPNCTSDDLLNLLISKNVDLILYAHKHSYQASKQLAFNGTTCTSLTTNNYNAHCVVNGTSKLTKGAGSVIVVSGTAGAAMVNISTIDPALGYFRTWEAANNNATWGVSQFTVSASQISMQFVGTSGGTFSDSFTITGNGSTPTPIPSPTTSPSPSATAKPSPTSTPKPSPSPTVTPSPSPSPTITPSPSPTSTPTPGAGIPVSKTWYFAEGRVGKGFREYLTIGNPTTNTCAVDVRYLYTMDGSSVPATKTASVTVSPASRTTESVNSDLGLPDSSTSAASLAASVTVNATATPNCTGVVAERPMYFSNYHGISSGTDVIGGTTLSTTYYFADVPTGASSSGSYTSYITILNPNTSVANITVNYYANGNRMQTQTLAVPANARGTIAPGAISLPQHVAAVVTSDQPVMVERPTYFTGVNGVSGAYDVVGAPTAAGDWLFAEGYTGAGYQEYLTIANVDPANTALVTVTLESGSGATNAINLSLVSKSQVIWNVNAANTFSESTPEVSAEVTAASSGASIVVQREIYFTYKHTLPQRAMGGTDVMGQLGPVSHSAYSFAEGYTNTGYNEWLTVQNPTGSDETIYVTLVNGLAKSSTQSYPVLGNSRFTLDVTALVQQIFNPGTNSTANAISMTVQTLDGSAFVAERPIYWNTSGVSSFVTAGGSDVIGYVGG